MFILIKLADFSKPHAHTQSVTRTRTVKPSQKFKVFNLLPPNLITKCQWLELGADQPQDAFTWNI